MPLLLFHCIQETDQKAKMTDQKLFTRLTNQHPNTSTNYSQTPPPPPSSTTNLNPPENHHLRCPRCDSSNTKFCYYNNYNLSQPRYFCKTCRRYWTRGGALRNVPIGGGCRKNKGATIAKQISSTGKLNARFSSSDLQKSNFINNLQHSRPSLWATSPQTSHLLSLLKSTPNPNFTSNANMFNPFWRNTGNNTAHQMHQELRSFPSNYYHNDQVAEPPVTNSSSSTSASTVANGESGFWNLMIPWSDLSITNSAYP